MSGLFNFMTTSAYPALTAAQKAFKTIVWDALVKTGEVALDGLQVNLFILDIPAVQALEDHVIEAITDAMFNQIILFMDVTAIRLINTELQIKWASASESLAIIAHEQGATSNAYLQALSNAASDFAAFVHTGP